MRRKNLIIILILWVLISGIPVFIYVQSAYCEDTIKSGRVLTDEDFTPSKAPRVLTDEDFLPNEVSKNKENIFYDIIHGPNSESTIEDLPYAPVVSSKEDREKAKIGYEKKARRELFVNSIISIILIFIIIWFREKLIIMLKKILNGIGSALGGAKKTLKAFMVILAKKRSLIGKIALSLIAIFAFYRCVIRPPVYYRGFKGSKVYNEQQSYDKVPTLDIYKLASEIFGVAILSGLLYFLLVKKSNKKNS